MHTDDSMVEQDSRVAVAAPGGAAGRGPHPAPGGEAGRAARRAAEATPPSTASTPWARVAQVGSAALLLLVVMVTAFVWPAVSGEPHGIRLGLVATAEASAEISAALEEAQPGAFDVVTYDDDEAARQAVADRELSGALVIGLDSARMLTAPAGSPAVAAALGQVAVALGARQAAETGLEVPDLLPVEAVVALPAGDPRGAGLASGALPLVLVSTATGVLAALTVAGLRRRVALVAGVALTGGPVVASVAGPWLDVLAGDFWVEAGVVALGIGAIALAIVAGHAALGRPGMALVAATVVFLGNPLSAAASAPELLPAGWADLGQALPPGALVSALRSVAYFGGAGSAAPLMVLAWWLVGAALVVTVVGVLAQGRAQVRARV